MMKFSSLRKKVQSRRYHIRQKRRFLKALEIVPMPIGENQKEFEKYLKFVRRCIAQVRWHIARLEQKAAK